MNNSFMKTNPAVSGLKKFKTNLATAENSGLMGKVNQLGINMVDLMMWLVIAALLLAAALQGIGFYQQAAWTYQARSDVSSVRTYMEAQYTLDANTYPTIVDGTLPGDLKLTGKNKTAAVPTTTGGWAASVTSEGLSKAGKDSFFNFSSTTNDNNPKANATAVGVTLTKAS